MASYNVIDPSRKDNDLVVGTDNGDSIYSGGDNSTINALDGDDIVYVYGNHSTVNAGDGDDVISLYGGSHNGGIWLEGEESNGVLGGAGNDSILVKSRGASIYGETGNDTINIQSSYTYADGGEGNDVFSFTHTNKVDNVTITGGAGNDKIVINGKWGPTIKAVITDFSNDDVFSFENTYYTNAAAYYSGTTSNGRTLTQHVENGNVVISDNFSIRGSSRDKLTKNVEPNISITLQGVSDISQVSNAKYYIYGGATPLKYSTLGELFDYDTSVVSQPVDTKNDDDETSETGGGSTTTTTTEEITTPSTPSTSGNSGGNTVINNYYGDYYDMSGNNGTIVNQSSVTGAVTNNTNIDNSTTITKEGNTYTYNGGDKVIDNYQQDEIVELASDYAGIDLNGNSFFVKSSSGQLEIQNSRDKFIGYSMHSERVAYSYWAGSEGIVDGRNYSQAEIMIGADNADNQIYAGDSGASLWGGIGGNDILTGGSGYNEFFYMVGGGNDVVQSSNSDDLVNLAGVSLSQISGVEVNIGQVNINFIDGGNLKVNGNSGVRYQIMEGTFSVNQYTKQWSNR
ncbi:MAG: hypothetical protein IKZ58_09725 [Selenomonadaceae bacterium]|nr:hypothetical protein [Selenomonadaceae bacterium]